jgi:MFS family permease
MTTEGDPASAPVSSPFAVVAFRSIWITNVISNLGSMIQLVGASWMMASLTSSPQMVALVQASMSLPIVLLALVAGAVADSFDRRRVMLVAQVFMLIVSILLGALVWSGQITAWSLLGLTFLIGCGTALNLPAWQAAVGDMVSRDALSSAVGLNSLGYNIARSAGPAIGGLIVAVAGVAAAFLANIVSYIALIGALMRWKHGGAERPSPRERLGKAIGAGLRHVAMSPNLKVVLVRACLFSFSGIAIQALLPVVARDLLRGQAGTYGVLLGAFGVGAVLGAFSSNRLRSRWNSEQIASGALLTLSVGTLLAVAGNIPIAVVGMTIAGAGWVWGLTTFNLTVQLAAPRWVVARAVAFYQMAVSGGMATGSWIFGMIAEVHGVANALVVATFMQALLLLLAPIRFRLPHLNALEQSASTVGPLESTSR